MMRSEKNRIIKCIIVRIRNKFLILTVKKVLRKEFKAKKKIDYKLYERLKRLQRNNGKNNSFYLYELNYAILSLVDLVV